MKQPGVKQPGKNTTQQPTNTHYNFYKQATTPKNNQSQNNPKQHGKNSLQQKTNTLRNFNQQAKKTNKQL